MSRQIRREFSRDLLMILRHNAPLYGLTIQANGFVQVDSLLKLRAFLGEEVADIRRVVQDFPQHLELAQFPETNPTRDELWYIRARDGHTIKDILIPDKPISAAEASGVSAMFCTSKTSWKRIKRAGAVHARSGYITFEPRVPQSNQVDAVLAVLDVAKTVQVGIELSWSTTGKIISSGDAANSLPLSLFSRIELPRRTRRLASSGGNNLSVGIHSQRINVIDRQPAPVASQSTPQRERITLTPPGERVSPSTPSPRFPSSVDPSALETKDGTDDGDDDVHIISSTLEKNYIPVVPDEPSAGRACVSPPHPAASRVQCKATPKWLIIPVAIPGCGKTGVCAALSYLFNLRHVQVGDVWKPARHRPARNSYLRAVSLALNDCDVVVADRNNHLCQHRAALRDLCRSHTKLGQSEVKTLVLNWSIRQPSPQAVYKHCTQRILSWRRGQQWFDAAPKAPLHRVLWTFLDRAEPLGVSEADAVIDMDPFEGLEASVQRAIAGIVNVLGLTLPTDERISAAIQAAQTYHPKMRMP